jgi:hypothetical protein
MEKTEINPELTKFAVALGELAVTGNNAAFLKLAAAEQLSVPRPVTKQANTADVLNYLKSVDPRILYGLGGLGAGGLVGLLQGKNKKRNALWYGLLGGLGGLGLGTFMSSTRAGGGSTPGSTVLADADKKYDRNSDGQLSADELRLVPRNAIGSLSDDSQESLRNLPPSMSANVGAAGLGVGAAAGARKAIDAALPTDLNKTLLFDSRGTLGGQRFTDPGQNAIKNLREAWSEIQKDPSKMPANLPLRQQKILQQPNKFRATRANFNAMSDLLDSDALRAMPNYPGRVRVSARDLSGAVRNNRFGRAVRGVPILGGVLTALAAQNTIPDVSTVRRQLPEVTSGPISNPANPPKPQPDTGLPW